MQIGKTIKNLRQKKGLKQIEFAKKCNLSQSYLSLIEKEKKEPTLSMLKQIAAVLEIPVPVLVFFSLNEDDIPQSKKEAFKTLDPLIKGMMTNIFMPEPV